MNTGHEGSLTTIHANSTRDALARLETMPNTTADGLQAGVRVHVAPGATVYTDAYRSYKGLGPKFGGEFVHQVIDHAEAYVDGQVHTNSVENFWSCLKRGLKGTYIAVEPFHLFRYVDEQAFRFNLRKRTDAQRFTDVIDSIVGRRLTYEQLIAALGESKSA